MNKKGLGGAILIIVFLGFIIFIGVVVLFSGLYNSSVIKTNNYCDNRSDGYYNISINNAIVHNMNVKCINKTFYYDDSGTCHSMGCLWEDIKLLRIKT